MAPPKMNDDYFKGLLKPVLPPFIPDPSFLSHGEDAKAMRKLMKRYFSWRGRLKRYLIAVLMLDTPQEKAWKKINKWHQDHEELDKKITKTYSGIKK